MADAEALIGRRLDKKPAFKAGAEFVTLDNGMKRIVGRAAAKRVDEQTNLLVPLFSNLAFAPFLKNLLCSMRRLSVSNWMVVSMDNATCPELRRTGFVDPIKDRHACVEPYLERPLVTAAREDYGSGGFWRLVVQRPLWIRWLLTKGYGVLQCDVDVVWMRNPLPYLTSMETHSPPKRCAHPASIYGYQNVSGKGVRWRQNAKTFSCAHHNSTLLVQSELGYGYNCGFYLVRPHASSIAFMDAWMEEMLHPTHHGVMHEQHAMLYTLGNLHSQTSRRWLSRGMQMVKLDEVSFPVGKVWYDHWASKQLSTDKRTAFILHCNWVVGGPQKKVRLRRDNLWFLDEHDEKCQPDFDPLERDCHRKCHSQFSQSCELGKPCPAPNCKEFAQRVVMDLAKSIKKFGVSSKIEDRWHPMSFDTCQGAQFKPDSNSTASGLGKLERAAQLVRSGADVRTIFADRSMLDPKIVEVRRLLGIV